MIRIIPRCRQSVLFALLLFAMSCATTPDAAPPTTAPTASGSLIRHEFTHPGLGTRFRIVVYCPDDAAIGRVETAVIRRVAELDEVFDDTRPTSEMAQVYANAGIGAVRVSDDLFGLLFQLQKLRGPSQGAFDVTAGAYAELWRASVATGTIPSPQQLEQARQNVGHEKLRLDPINRTVHITTPGVRLNLADVIPGYACDRILAALRSAGMPSALVDAGGRIAVGDPPPGRDAWLIEVTNTSPTSPNRVMRLKRQAIASSGHIGDAVRIGDVRFSRIVNPLTGIGARNIVPVTAVASRAWQADAVSRAASVLGETDAHALIRAASNVRLTFHTPAPPARPSTRPTTRPAATTRRSPLQ